MSCGRGVQTRKLKIWKIRSVFKCFRRFCKFGKVRKTEETLANYSEKPKCLKKKKKKLSLRFRVIFLKICKGFVKGFAPWILFDCFEEKFLYPLECREVPSGS